jgi:hypothetical protein
MALEKIFLIYILYDMSNNRHSEHFQMSKTLLKIQIIFNYDVPPTDRKGLNPHITIAKLSKVPFELKKKGTIKYDLNF